MHSSCNTKWWITLAWIWRHETTSKRKLACEWPTAHMSKILIHNNVSFIFYILLLGNFPLHSIYLRNFWKKIEKAIISSISYEFLFCSAAINSAKSLHFSVRETGVEPVRTFLSKRFSYHTCFCTSQLDFQVVVVWRISSPYRNVAQLKPHSYFVHRMP